MGGGATFRLDLLAFMPEYGSQQTLRLLDVAGLPRGTLTAVVLHACMPGCRRELQLGHRRLWCFRG